VYMSWLSDVHRTCLFFQHNILYEALILLCKDLTVGLSGYKVWEPSMESSHRLQTLITDPQQY
jgi:ethanolamine utilization protein EutP (predicted NTPase)